jgi:hypothetical protein
VAEEAEAEAVAVVAVVVAAVVRRIVVEFDREVVGILSEERQ